MEITQKDILFLTCKECENDKLVVSLNMKTKQLGISCRKCNDFVLVVDEVSFKKMMDQVKCDCEKCSVQ